MSLRIQDIRTYAGTTLRPTAVEVDRTGVGADRIAGLANAGLLNHLAPAEFGGAETDTATDRQIAETLAGACPNTWLVWTQHAPQVGRLAALYRDGVDLPDTAYEILRGERIAGAALSDVRRYPDRYIRATRVRGGWRLDGTVSWVSGWGISTVLTVAAVDPGTETVVTALVPVGEGFRPAQLQLAALNGSRTYRVGLEGVVVADDNVLSREPMEQWRRRDTGVATDAKPHHFGVAAAVLDELEREDDPLAGDIAGQWRPVIASLREEAYALTDASDAADRVSERLGLKVAATEALTTLTGALLTARAGHGLGLDDTAQLYARTALFIRVQGQNAAVRRAQLTHFTHPHLHRSEQNR